jgi:hypothetical protein
VTKTVNWKRDVDPQDFMAALNYLSLRLDMDRASLAVAALQNCKLTSRRVNDIVRATGGTPLPRNDPGVQKNLRKIRNGRYLSPVLIVSYELGGEVADGWHRVCGVYHTDPFAEVPCRLVHVPDLERS